MFGIHYIFHVLGELSSVDDRLITKFFYTRKLKFFNEKKEKGGSLERKAVDFRGVNIFPQLASYG